MYVRQARHQRKQNMTYFKNNKGLTNRTDTRTEAVTAPWCVLPLAHSTAPPVLSTAVPQ